LAVLVIGGSGRGAGKTAVGCALMRAMPELRWVAVKVTPHEHAVPEVLWEETDRHSERDTGRYLAAGAERSFLLAANGDRDAHWIADGVAEARRISAEQDGLLIESGRFDAALITRPDEPVLRLTVLGGASSEWKPSLGLRLAFADAMILADGLSREQFAAELQLKPGFQLPAMKWSTPELVAFVRARLRLAGG
jgi:hypothetical protein